MEQHVRSHINSENEEPTTRQVAATPQEAPCFDFKLLALWTITQLLLDAMPILYQISVILYHDFVIAILSNAGMSSRRQDGVGDGFDDHVGFLLPFRWLSEEIVLNQVPP